jgi:transcriptional regulator with PAS, ATPase and Fis domain
MSPRLQVKLLRVLQDGEFEPVGSMHTVSVDVRVVAATNMKLREAVQAGAFREDLFYRLNVIPIHLPPLRERREDIPLLVDYFMEKYNAENDKIVTKLSRQVLDLLVGYSWPGNVRELENCIERAVIMSPEGELSLGALPEEIAACRKGGATGRSGPGPDEKELRRIIERLCDSTPDLRATMAGLTGVVEEVMIRKALASGMSRKTLADRLEISRMTLRKRMRKHGIKA